MQLVSGSGIKKVLRGSTNINASSTVTNVTIASSDMAKSEVRLLGGNTSVPQAKMTTATQIQVSRAGATDLTGVCTINWELTEWY